MCIRKCDSTLSTSLQRKPLQLEDGVVSRIKGFGSFFKSLFGTSAFFIGHNPMNIRVRTRLTNSKISWIDIQFASSKLTAVIRGSSPGCRVDKDNLVNPVQQRGQGKSRKRKY
jgi:hypothetical protein